MGFRRGLRRGRVPDLRVPLRDLVAGRDDRGEERTCAWARAAGLQSRRLAVSLRRDDDHDGDHEAAPAAAVAALHGPRLGLRAPVPLLVHAPCRRRPGEPAQRHPAARRGRARRGLPRGRQGDREAVSRALPRAALRSRGLRRGRPAHRLAHRPRCRRRLRGDLPEARREPGPRARRRGAVRAPDADLPLARASSASSRYPRDGGSSSASRSTSPPIRPRRRRTSGSSWTSPRRSARRSSRSSTRTWSTGARPSSEDYAGR